jgi:hypothetical protein
MNCEEARRQILEQPDPLAELEPEVQRHLEGCPGCRALRDDLGRVRGALGGVPLPGLPAGFELSLRRRLEQVAAQAQAGSREAPRPGQGRPRRLRRVGLAAAAVLLVAVGVALWSRQQATLQPAPTHHRLGLAVEADRAFSGAIFDLTLPQGVRLPAEAGRGLLGGGGLRWRSSLLPGVNQVQLPLVSRGADRPLVVRLTAGGRTVRARVSLGGSRKLGGLRGLRGVMAALGDLLLPSARADTPEPLRIRLQAAPISRQEASELARRLRQAVTAGAAPGELARLRMQHTRQPGPAPVGGSVAPAGGSGRPADEAPPRSPGAALKPGSDRRPAPQRPGAGRIVRSPTGGAAGPRAAPARPGTPGEAAVPREGVKALLLKDAERLGKASQAGQGTGQQPRQEGAGEPRQQPPTPGDKRLHAPGGDSGEGAGRGAPGSGRPGKKGPAGIPGPGAGGHGPGGSGGPGPRGH